MAQQFTDDNWRLRIKCFYKLALNRAQDLERGQQKGLCSIFSVELKRGEGEKVPFLRGVNSKECPIYDEQKWQIRSPQTA